MKRRRKNCVLLRMFILCILANNLFAAEKKLCVKGNKFNITLKANPTTGYAWTIKQYDDKNIEVVNDKYIRQRSRRLGVGGFRRFDFKLTNKKYKGKQTIRFYYARPWLEDQGEEAVYNIYINTKCKKKKRT